MHKIRCFILIVLFSFSAGCIQSTNIQSIQNISENSVPGIDSLNNKSNKAKDTSINAVNSKTTHSNILDSISGVNDTPCNTSSTSNKKHNGALSASQASAPCDKQKKTIQEEIDHALGLCQSAQELWEKGELEHALAKLDMAYSTILTLDTNDHPEFNQQKEDMRYMISKRILEIYASRSIVVTGKYNAIPLTMNKYVKQQIARFTGPDRCFLIQSMKRAGQYQPYIASEMKKAGLPQELSWLPLIESGFKIRALSKSRALGLWQFIASTGYKFGLNRNYYIDERLDPVKSTRAAISYLKELHKIFGDWTTVLAAYNCGEGRVLRIIRQQNINYLDNFWDLFQRLPRETAAYVPRFLAVLNIINNPSKYNIKIPDVLPPVRYKIFTINKQIRLKDIAREIKVNYKILKDLNPELRYALLPPEEYKLRIPESKSALFAAKLNKIKLSYPPPARYVYHRVKHGETLSSIARKFHTSVRSIASLNGISHQNIIVRGKVLKIASLPYNKRTFYPSGPSSIIHGRAVKYIVKRGDNLWLIARRYNTTTKLIMTANNMSNSALHINQVIKIPSGKTYTTRNNTTTYSVKSGDSPFTIAKKYNMSLKRLLSLNHLSKGSTIYPGQRLLVE